MGSPQDRTIQIGKVRARYWDEGSQGEPVVLIHGLGGYVENWLPSFDALAAQHRVVAVDLPGHGRTEKPKDASYGVENLAGFVKDFMAARQIERAHVVGHSMGGAVATRLVLMHPATVDRLALVAPAGFGKEFHPMVRLSSAPLLGELLTRPSRSGSADFARTAVHDPAVITDELIENSTIRWRCSPARKRLRCAPSAAFARRSARRRACTAFTSVVSRRSQIPSW